MDRKTALERAAQGDPQGRALALRDLRRWTGPDVLQTLTSALRDEERPVREAALGTLIEIGDREAVPLLVPILAGDAPAARNAARTVLERLGRVDPEALRDLSRNPDARMRIFAANIIGATGDQDHAPRLLDMLADADANVQDAAVVALGNLAAPEAVGPLSDLALRGPSWIRFSAIDALGRIARPEAVEALRRLLGAVEEDFKGPIQEALTGAGEGRA